MDDMLRKRAEWFMEGDEGELCPPELREDYKNAFLMLQDTVRRMLYLIDDLELTIKVMKATDERS